MSVLPFSFSQSIFKVGEYSCSSSKIYTHEPIAAWLPNAWRGSPRPYDPINVIMTTVQTLGHRQGALIVCQQMIKSFHTFNIFTFNKFAKLS